MEKDCDGNCDGMVMVAGTKNVHNNPINYSSNSFCIRFHLPHTRNELRDAEMLEMKQNTIFHLPFHHSAIHSEVNYTKPALQFV